VAITLWSKSGDAAYELGKEHLVNIPVANSAAEFFSFFKFPDWSFLNNGEVWMTAVTLALVASLETLLGIEAIDKLDTLKRVTPSNRELIAQGSGNIVSGMLGGLPLTSVIVRSSANLHAGAKTKLSAIFHGLLILAFVSFFPAILNMIPKAALAAILVFTGYKLARIALFKDFFKKGWDQFMPFVITIIAIVFTDLLKGVLIGMGVGIFFILRSNFRSAIFVLKENGNVLIRMRKDISFFSKPILKYQLEKIAPDSKVIIDMARAEFIDKDVLDTIEEFIQRAHLKNITVELKKSTYNESSKISVPAVVIDDDMAH
jgi:MFS superfamily sulfate permease-like transporter